MKINQIVDKDISESGGGVSGCIASEIDEFNAAIILNLNIEHFKEEELVAFYHVQRRN